MTLSAEHRKNLQPFTGNEGKILEWYEKPLTNKRKSVNCSNVKDALNEIHEFVYTSI